MAYAENELVSDGVVHPVQERAVATAIRPKTLAPDSGTPTLPPLTPLAYNTSTNKWVVWTSGGTNGTGSIRGFLWPDPVTLDASDDVLAQVMFEGRVHFDDIPLPEGEDEANLKAALRTDMRDLGIHVTGLDQVR